MQHIQDMDKEFEAGEGCHLHGTLQVKRLTGAPLAPLALQTVVLLCCVVHVSNVVPADGIQHKHTRFSVRMCVQAPFVSLHTFKTT
jgi:hypothetical protein